MNLRIVVVVTGVALVVGTVVSATEVGGFSSTTHEPSAKSALARPLSFPVFVPSSPLTPLVARPDITINGKQVIVGPDESVQMVLDGGRTIVSRSGNSTSVTTQTAGAHLQLTVTSVQIIDGSSSYRTADQWSQSSPSTPLR